MKIIFSISENLFSSGQGHLIWAEIPIGSELEAIPRDIGHRAECKIFYQNFIYFEGVAFLKRREQKNFPNSIVVLVPEKDLGIISPDSCLEIDTHTLVAK